MRRTTVCALAMITGVLALLTPFSAAQAVDSPAGRLVSDAPAGGTPHVLNGAVASIAQVGDTMVLGGSFTSARNNDSQTPLPRNRLLAFDANTGQISTTFMPNPDGTITTVIPAGDGESVYVAGSFSTIGGVARKNVARVRVSDGAVLTAFNAGNVTGQVKDLRLTAGRLWLAGAFTHVNGKAQRGLATVNATTGAFDTYMRLTLAGVHNGSYTAVAKIDVTPNGQRLVAIGNFDTLNGVKNHQMFMLDLSGATAAPSAFRTSFYESACSSSFDSYMRDLDFSPDGSFFVISTTGGYGGSEAACDTTARFETGSTGSGIRPSWTDYTGGDTTYAVEITDSVVYTGGHARWQNNPFRGDNPGQGAVARPGIAALDPLNGLPLSWNPTRTRGVGVFDFLVTSRGLWVASDTDRIGAYMYKGRIALMPLNGAAIPALRTPTLPNDVYVAGGGSSPLPTNGVVRRSYNGTTVGATTTVANGGIDWNTVRGAFMLNGQLYVAHSNGTFTRRSFDGTTYGTPVAVDTSDELTPLTDWRTDISQATGMFFDSGRIYFTRSNSNQLFYRYFTPESDVVGAKRFVASNNVAGIDFAQVRGMFTTGTQLFWAKPDGTLNRIDWQDGALSDTPVGGTAALVSGPGVDANRWNARTLFLFQDASGGGTGAPPAASFTSACTSLVCSFDASGSTAPGTTITGYSWNFGDGSTGTGAAPSHTYASTGTRTVTLTITTGTGATATTTRSVTATQANRAPVASFTSSCNELTCSFDAGGSSDPDGNPLTYSWDFGDTTTGTGVTTSRTYPSAGQRTVTLTVSDGTLSGTATGTVSPAQAVQAQVEFVAAASTSGNRGSHTVRIPAGVEPGDTLVMFLTTNSTNSTVNDAVPGWTLLQSQDGNGVRGRAWTRTAAAGDTGTNVTVSTSGLAKSTLSVGAYRGAGAALSQVTASAASVVNSPATSHTTPSVAVSTPGSWLVSSWSEKSSTDTTWSAPAGTPVRTQSAGTGSGKVSGLLGDSGGPVSTGTAAGRTATTSTSVGRTVMFSVVIAPQ